MPQDATSKSKPTNREFQLYLFSGVASQVVGVAVALAIPLVIYRHTQSLVAAGIIETILALVSLVAGIIGGSLADMKQRKKIIPIGEVLAALTACATAVLIASDTFNIIAFGALLSLEVSCSAVSGASIGSSLPQLVPREKLASAEGLMQARMQAAGLVGPVFGGFLLSINDWLPFLASGLSALISAACFVLIKSPLEPQQRAQTSLLKTTMGGLSLVIRNAFVRNLIIVQLFLNSAMSGALFLSVIALEEAEYNNYIIGFARAAIGVIGVLGALATGYLQKRFSLRTLMFLNGINLTVMLSAVALLTPTLAMVIPLGLCVIFAPAANAVVYAKMYDLLDEDIFGRATNTQVEIVTAGSGLWSTPLGYISHAWSITIGVWSCALLALGGLCSTFFFDKAVRALEVEQN
ncbi:MFS transporter [Corynebacterium sp. sy017]|uniref:MFS transporter n=1 Tax=unclassified Corynebacterium TaxID=2624378 RepID=UPI00118495D2|nr:MULTISPECIES: MFS transporter [unclassified Corynebacterium]MBP3089236.1 MFS transporter [Corynebacterium sp. sy017]TSD91057.1 MFS transporter [Corynebacterium sp. SY003]